MTYRVFLAAVLAPQLALAVVGYGMRRKEVRRAAAYVGVLSFVAVAYTMPWDRWLIRHGVWSYPPGSVLGTIGTVPIEEYLFMIGQTAIVTLWSLTIVTPPSNPPPRHAAALRTTACAGWLLASAAGFALAASGPGHGLYLGVIVGWYGLPLALQAAAGADALRRARRLRLAGLAPTLLLWTSDAYAIHEGAWRISPAHTLGASVLGLPVEEAVFFLLTNLLVVDSVLLLADEFVRARMAEWAKRI
jgi:lycopene cyclase domain-containing protein